MIETRKLRHIVALADTRSYARAAQALNISQPALSRSIQSVEQRFGVRLFDRGRRGVTLTPTGSQVLGEAQQLLRDAETLERNLKLLGSSKMGDLSFGLDPLAAGIFLPDALAFLGRNYVDLHVQAVVQVTTVMERQLLAHEIEFFITPGGALSDSPLIAREDLSSVRVALLVRRGHPLLGRDGVTLADLTGYPLIAGNLPEHVKRTGGGHPLWRAATIRCDDYGLMRDVALRSDAIWLACPALASGPGEESTLVELPIDQLTPLPRAELVVASLKGLSRSPSAAMLLAKLKALSADG